MYPGARSNHSEHDWEKTDLPPTHRGRRRHGFWRDVDHVVDRGPNR